MNSLVLAATFCLLVKSSIVYNNNIIIIITVPATDCTDWWCVPIRVLS